MRDYRIERDWMAHGLRCVAVMTSMGHRCGYVGLPTQHPLHGKGCSDEVECLRSMANKVSQGTIGKRNPIHLFLLGCSDKFEATPENCFDVHGSLTFAAADGKYPAEGEEWWFGFDCSHCDDAPDIKEIKNPSTRGIYMDLDRKIPDRTVRTLDYVSEETEGLAEQLASVKEA